MLNSQAATLACFGGLISADGFGPALSFDFGEAVLAERVDFATGLEGGDPRPRPGPRAQASSCSATFAAAAATFTRL
jgi:hypothetical protein